MILMNKSIKIVIGLAFILLPIIGGIVFRLCVTETKPSPAAYTTDELYSFSSAIGEILGSGNTIIEDLLFHPSQNDLKPALANFLRKQGFASRADHLMGQDGWGRPYNIDWRTNLFNRPTAMLKANENSLLIWSSGENGINEFGGGDDSYNSTDWQLYIECYKQSIQEGWNEDGQRKDMLTNGVWSYSYDAENRLTAAYSNTVCVVSNAYDYMNRRVLKVTPDATHTFIYDGWNLIQETIATASGVSTNTYVWGKDLSGTMQGAGGVGGLLAVSLDGEWYFPFADANGNITAYVDENGSIVAKYTYDAFGDTITQSGSMADTFRFRFSTKYYDSETGLYYYGMRFYLPNLHRWINRDPIEEKGGFGLYGFCGNDGVNRWDILGQKWHVEREGEPYAIAYADSNGDTFDGLAIEIQLDTSDYKKWAHTSDSRPIKCKKYKTPNTVYYHYGPMKASDNWIGSTYRAMRIPAQKEENDYKENRSFNTIRTENVDRGTILSALQDEYLYQYTFTGHGATGGHINSYGDRGSLIPLRYTKYGIRFLVLNACWSAQSPYHEDPVDPTAQLYRYNKWEWNVAKRGWFFGYSDYTWVGNSLFTWSATQGKNTR